MTGQVNSGAQTVSLPILGRVFVTDRMYRAAVQPIAVLSAIHRPQHGSRQNPD